MPIKSYLIVHLCLVTTLAGCQRPLPVGLYEVQAHENVEYVRRGERSLMMDIYRPKDAPNPHPGIVLFHGGGWIMGDRSEMTPMARYLASIGYTAATAQYRLIKDDIKYPAPIADALAAVKFMRKSAAAYDVDPQRIGVIGYSAGAQLALLVGLAKDPSVFKDDSYPDVSSSVTAVVDISGPTAFKYIFRRGPIARYLGLRYLGAPPEQLPEKWEQASPITHVRKDGPPVLILHGEKDDVVTFQQSIMLANEMKRVGATHLLVRMPAAKHDWLWPFGRRENLLALPLLTHFLTKYLEPCVQDSPTRP